MAKRKKTGKENAFVKYERLLEQAKVQGRIDGPCKCIYCGMRYKYQKEADACCKMS